MEIETYEEITLDEQSGAIINETVSEEALALIEALGLEGQKALIESRAAGDETTEARFPYRLITLEERRVFEACFPVQTKLVDFKSAPIPLRVLQVAAHAKDFCDELIVWHPATDVLRDPVLVGLKSIPTQGGVKTTETYLLARWGTALEPLAVLKEKAREILTVKWTAEVNEKLREAKRAAEALPDTIALYLNGDDRTVGAMGRGF